MAKCNNYFAIFSKLRNYEVQSVYPFDKSRHDGAVKPTFAQSECGVSFPRTYTERVLDAGMAKIESVRPDFGEMGSL